MRQNRDRCKRRNSETLSLSQKLAAYTIVTNAGRREISSATVLLQAASAVSRRANPPGGATEWPSPTGCASESAPPLHATGFPAVLRIQAARTQLRLVPGGISDSHGLHHAVVVIAKSLTRIALLDDDTDFEDSGAGPVIHAADGDHIRPRPTIAVCRHFCIWHFCSIAEIDNQITQANIAR